MSDMTGDPLDETLYFIRITITSSRARGYKVTLSKTKVFCFKIL